MEEAWTILELAELAADALTAAQPTGSSAGAGLSAGPGRTEAGPSAEGGSSAGPRAGSSAGGGTPSGAARRASARANGRVRDVPNERLVRWYVTVGLVDPPLSRRGRVARYGRRHLLQLVAVKRRQAEGRSLAEIQAELAGATDEALAAVARVPDTKPALQPATAVVAATSARFWTRSAAQRDPAAEEPGAGDLAAAAGAGDLAPEGPGAGAGRARAGGSGRRGGAGDLGAAVGARRALSAARGDPADRGGAGSCTGSGSRRE